ncbi:uncharacterized protein LOC135691973 isoform X2 [Rhopilema esculentum]
MPGFDHFNVANLPLRITKRDSVRRPKTLVCHDMRGGYTEDRYVQGFNSTACYSISQWNFIDTFVYFSHNLVTIPPPCWTNCCHQHGVKVLGTFITEWDDGAKHCANILESKASYTRFANQLVGIACYYQFDGWLVNIENQIQASQVENLIGFLDILTKRMHASNPSSQVIWYDSVTVQGELKWQDELNANNSKFFDVCDGIFLNYTWSVHHLSRSSIIAGSDRNFDVYVGVDCFGRGCFGGGGWNTYKALQVIREHNLSAAIFAPGWVLETQGEDNFTSNQSRFWRLIAPYLYPHFPVKLPILSSFCQGFGKHYFSSGKKLISTSWTHLSCQQLQPSFNDEYFVLGPKKGIEIKDIGYCIDDGFEGGGCLKIEGDVNTRIQGSRAIFRLFRCGCHLDSPIIVSFTFKVKYYNDLQVYLLLLLEGKPNYTVLAPLGQERKAEKQNEIMIGNHEFNASRQVDSSSCDFPVGESGNYMILQPLHGKEEETMNVILGRNNVNWKTRYYLISEKNARILKEIRLACTATSSVGEKISPFSLLLGEVRVHAVQDLVPEFPVINNMRFRDSLVEDKDDHFVLSTTIMWDCLARGACQAVISNYNVFWDDLSRERYEEDELGIFLGKAFVQSFRATRFDIPKTTRKNIIFYVQPVTDCCIKAPKDECGAVMLQW